MLNEDTESYDYTTAGFDKFFNRSVDDTLMANLDSQTPATNISRFDDQQISGAMGDIFLVGKIKIDGITGRISIFDDVGNEITRIGELDG